MRTRNGAVREVRLELGEADELFTARAPDVASGTPALPPGIEQIRSELSAARSSRTAVATVIVLPRAGLRPGLERDITRAVGRYCETETRRADNELRALRREGLRALAGGCIILAAFLYFSERVLASPLPYIIKDFFGNGLFLVVAWVGLWYPIDTLVYSGRPYRLEKHVLRVMQEMKITVRAAD